MELKKIKELEKELLKEKDLQLSIEAILSQIEIFKKGVPYLKLYKPCLIGNGIKVFREDEKQTYSNLYRKALQKGRVIKFVPASGAATRMFKKQLSVLNNKSKLDLSSLKLDADKGDEDSVASLEFFKNIQRFAFYGNLENLTSIKGNNLSSIISKNDISSVIRLVATEEGLNYSDMPKGSIPFHTYPEGARTAFEEHLVEAMVYSAGKDKVVKIHFTISPEHEMKIRELFKSLIHKYSSEGWKFDIKFSFQSPATDTISVTPENKPFRDDEGKIVFRPGGHGALLKNLNDLKADIILIKNIDNVVPDHLKLETYKYKKIIGGYLIYLQQKIFEFLQKLSNNDFDENLSINIIKLIDKEFGIDLTTNLDSKSLTKRKKYLFDFLNRPIRVCGMVRKEGHPGGGPFGVIDYSGNISLQIVETAQIDLSDKNQLEIFNESTHFSPVDIACGVKDYFGNNFELQKYSNPETGLITEKSKGGRELKALELPGLWNGGMYHWLTVFVEVPKITFNPVKEINDLLRSEHQPEKI